MDQLTLWMFVCLLLGTAVRGKVLYTTLNSARQSCVCLFVSLPKIAGTVEPHIVYSLMIPQPFVFLSKVLNRYSH